jgi:hypothetical protein
VFIHDNVRPYLFEYPTTDSYHIDSLNSRVHIRSRLRSGGENMTITITQEQVIDVAPLSTSRLHLNSNEGVIGLMSMTKQKRPGSVEGVVGLDESMAD